MQLKEDSIIPDQEKGTKTDASENVKTYTTEEAQVVFEEAKEKLLDINNWHNLSGIATATFQLTDDRGNELNRPAAKGDLIKIDIPAPGTISGGGFDWVRIEEIINMSDPENDSTLFGIRVRPAGNPKKATDNTAHFFTEAATSSFVVMRKGNEVTASVHGRNEIPNTTVNGVIDTTRNAIIALSAMAGLATTQWKDLINGLLEKNL